MKVILHPRVPPKFIHVPNHQRVHHRNKKLGNKYNLPCPCLHVEERLG
jgi:hypothetical protein